jgi:hypothetical protein
LYCSHKNRRPSGDFFQWSSHVSERLGAKSYRQQQKEEDCIFLPIYYTHHNSAGCSSIKMLFKFLTARVLPYLPKNLTQLTPVQQVFTLFSKKLTSVDPTSAGFYLFSKKLTSVDPSSAGFYLIYRKTYLS